ncbi:non-specific lipid transfer protein GPI-anchored 5-like [Triticum urartu]|uniref:non-specific lipid transfer protein GPI-anchored 5-like n=1 Tax=Triticum urartu TaxID=4572 RepID=UPI002043C87D|nr:non-specific lipid transfer protein GPI-anchored 5-like [Triticum urartu]
MARRVLGVVAVLVLVATATRCSAQTTTMTMPTCAPVPLSLSPCIGYLFGVGSAALPSCCSQLQAFFQSQGPCLCAMSKLAPSPFGLVLGQVQGMIPNVCNLPTDPCDDVFGASNSTDDSATPTAKATAPEAAPPAATPAEPATTPESAGATEAPPAAGDDSPAVATKTGQVAPQAAGPSTDSQGISKLPELLHAAGAPSSAAATVLISVFLAYVSAMFV